MSRIYWFNFYLFTNTFLFIGQFWYTLWPVFLLLLRARSQFTLFFIVEFLSSVHCYPLNIFWFCLHLFILSKMHKKRLSIFIEAANSNIMNYGILFFSYIFVNRLIFANICRIYMNLWIFLFTLIKRVTFFNVIWHFLIMINM